MEEAETECISKARQLLEEYKYSFLKISYTVHPSNIQGEMKGKSSNIAWASSQIAKDCERTDLHIMTIIDADSCLARDYFDAVSYYYSSASPITRKTLMFAPPTIFDR